MKAIFLKEWRQAHLLPWAGLLLSALVVALYALWVILYAQTGQDVEDAEAFCTVVLLLATLVMALVATAGSLASEIGTGAISYLLALPVSRSRIWAGKALAALALAGLSAVLLFLPASIAIPGVRHDLQRALLYLPDVAVWMLCVLAITLFCSTLFARPLTVFLVAPATAIALGLLFLLGINFLHFLVLRYDYGSYPSADFSLWALLATPPFLLASWVAFRRGELFDSRRHRLLGLAVLGGGLAAVALLLYAGGRWEWRYVRGQVVTIAATSLPPGGKVAALLVRGNPAPISRDPRKGWQFGDERTGQPRNEHVLLVNLATGREVVWSEGGRQAGGRPFDGQLNVLPSPDGRLLLQAEENSRSDATRLRVWEVASRRCLLDQVVPLLSWGRDSSISGELARAWSPQSRWLAWDRMASNVPPGGTMPAGQEVRETWYLAVVRSDGSLKRELTLTQIAYRPHQNGPDGRPVRVSPETIVSWKWAPDDSLYLLNDKGELSRYAPADGSRTLLWRGPALLPGPDWHADSAELSASPDGRHLAVYLHIARVYPATETHPEGHQARSHVFLLAFDAPKPRLLADITDNLPPQLPPPLTWSGEGRLLLIGFERFWQEGLTQPSPVAVPARSNPNQWHQTFPFGSGVLVWGPDTFVVDARGQVRRLDPHTVVSVPQGTDAQGRLIVRHWRASLAALDPRRGTTPLPIYP